MSTIIAISKKNELIAKKEKTIYVLESEVAHLKSLVNNTWTIINKSVSVLTYVKNYKNASLLEPLADYTLISYEQNSTGFVENIISEYKNNIVCFSLGLTKIFEQSNLIVLAQRYSLGKIINQFTIKNEPVFNI